MQEHDVVGIGNAIVDIIARCDEAFLERHGCSKVSPQLGGGEIDAELIGSARIVYLEGYLFDRPEAKAAFRQTAEIAAKAGRQVALSLSDAFCVDRHRAEFLELIRASVDILFANEAEITSLYQTKSFDEAARQAQADTRLAALTRSEKGSV